MNKNTTGMLLILTLLTLTGCKEKVDSLQAGVLFNCATHGGEVSCWGLFANFRGSDVEARGWQLSPLGYIRKQFDDPKVSVGGTHFCVLDQQEVECFLSNDSGEINVPELSDPYEVAAGTDFSCALDSNGLTCWGDSPDLSRLPDVLENPSMLVAGNNHICLKDINGFYCSGFTWFGDGNPTPPAHLTAPEAVTVSGETGITCAKQGEWTCWGDSYPGNMTSIFASPDADWVEPGFQQTCSLKDGDISCMGYGIAGPVGIEVPERAVNARLFDIAGGHACAVNGFGVTCWGPDIIGLPVNVPPYL